MERTRQGMFKICDEYASIIMEANRRRVSVYDAAGADKLKELQRQCTAYINRERILVNDQDSEGYHLALIVRHRIKLCIDMGALDLFGNALCHGIRKSFSVIGLIQSRRRACIPLASSG